MAAIVPDPESDLVISQPTKIITKNGIDFNLAKLTNQFREDKNLKSNISTKEQNKASKKGKRIRLTCHTCRSPNCTDPSFCHGAVSCYTSQFRDTEGVIHRSKGKK